LNPGRRDYDVLERHFRRQCQVVMFQAWRSNIFYSRGLCKLGSWSIIAAK